MSTIDDYDGPPPTAPPAPEPIPSTDPDGSTDPHGPVDEVLPGRIERVRRGPRSLTSKLTVFVVSLVVALVGMIGTATYFSLRSFLDQRLEQQLRSTATQNAGFVPRCLDNVLQVDGQYQCPFSPQTQQEWIGAIQLSSGQYITFESDTDELKRLELTVAQRQLLLNDPKARLTVDVNGHTLRVAASPTRDGGLLVATGLSTDEINRTLGRLVLLEVVIGGAAVILALIATTYGVRFSLRRLRRVTTTAQEVATDLSSQGTGLERRVPDDEPDTEVGQLATSFNTMLAAVETQFAARVESEQRMRQFMADASHELRTPLTSIRGYAELARMQRAVGSTSDDNLDRIESEGTRMSRLVEDLLLLARGDADGDQRPGVRQLIDVPGLLDDAVAGSRAAFASRKITVDATPGTHVLGDPDQLVRVVRNLVTNAAVHTQADRPIRVHSHADPDGVVIQVIDGGPGLPPDEAAHVFERFWRADKARTRARGGSGLGLSIVDSIVHAHGGSVRFDSTVEGGSTVTVRLPGVEAD